MTLQTLPKWLVRLQNVIFNNLPKADAKTWLEAFLDSIEPGADVELVRHKLAIRRMDRLIKLQMDALIKGYPAEINDVIKETLTALTQVRQCHEAATGSAAWSAKLAWSAAEAAGSAAKAAAKSAAWSATAAVSVSVSAAEAAAEAAMWSAASAAKSAAWSAILSTSLSAKSAAEAAMWSAASAAKSAAWSATAAVSVSAAVWSAELAKSVRSSLSEESTTVLVEELAWKQEASDLLELLRECKPL